MGCCWIAGNFSGFGTSCHLNAVFSAEHMYSSQKHTTDGTMNYFGPQIFDVMTHELNEYEDGWKSLAFGTVFGSATRFVTDASVKKVKSISSQFSILELLCQVARCKLGTIAHHLMCVLHKMLESTCC